MLSVDDWTAIFTGAQAIIMFIGFFLTILQLRSSRNDSRAQFWFKIKTHFYRFEDIATSLRPGGKWQYKIPPDAESWSRVDEYLGMFEYCEMLLKRNIIDEDFFKIEYRVQLSNAIGHPQINEKINNPNENEYWKTLFELCERLDINY